MQRRGAAPGLGEWVAVLCLSVASAACGSASVEYTLTCGDGTTRVGSACVAVSADATAPLSCGPGTVQRGNECVPGQKDGGGGPGSHDAARGAGPDAPEPSTNPDAAGAATSFAVDPAHDNAQPDESVASPLTVSWIAKLTGASSYPLIVDGKVFVATGGLRATVRALDLATGAPVWGPLAFGQAALLAYDAGRLFVLGDSGLLEALDSATGAHLWTTSLTLQSFYDSPPVAALGFVYVNGYGGGGTTYGIEAATGKTVWHRGTFDGSDGAPAVYDGVVFEAEACDQLSAFDAMTGKLQWFHSGPCTGGGGAAPSAYKQWIWERDWAQGDVIIDTKGHDVGSFVSDVVPALHHGTAFYVSMGSLTAVDVGTSTIRWTFTGDGNLCTAPVVAGKVGQVFVGSSSGRVYELDEATGAQKSVWKQRSVTCGDETNAMALGLGHLVVPAGDSLVVY